MEQKNIKTNVSIEYADTTLILSPSNGKYKYCLIWLHGLAYFPHRFLNFFLTEQLIGLLDDFKIVIPQSPIRTCTLMKAETCSWYDIKIRDMTLPFDEQFSREEILESTKIIHSIIHAEAEKLEGDYTKVFLGGFSQGCAMTFQAGFGFEKKLGGLFGWSGYIFEISPEYQDEKNVLIIHGKADIMRPWEQVEKTYEKVKNKENVRIELIEGMGHDYYADDARALLYQFIRNITK